MTWFPSKVDKWLAVVLAIAPVISVTMTIATVVAGESMGFGLAGCALLAAVYLGLIFPMRYGIGGGELVVRHGLVRQRCRLSEIVEVHPTRNPLSSPALSLDRLMVRKGDRFRDAVMISPADKEGFVALLAREAGLEREGDTLRRPAGPA
jgi:hypothetical protein